MFYFRPAGLLLLVCSISTSFLSAENDRPNILWIVSEDNGPFLGCYGDENAKTPNLDRLAGKGIRYTNFFANAPVCAVARSSWIFGAPAVSTGTLHMRSQYRVPRERFKTYPELIKASGYYVTNNYKTDYNTRSIRPKEVWNESSREAHYEKRPDGAPFLAVFNLFDSHESRIFPENKPSRRRVPAEAITLPPYQIETPEMIDDWRAYYERLEMMDHKVGEILADLEASGQADNTIIFYCSDHGGVTMRSKRYLYDSGSRVPLIVAFPEKWQHLAPSAPGSVSERLVQFVDLPKTFLTLVGLEPPEAMSGHVFLGNHIDPEPESVFLFSGRFDASPDNSRAVTDGRWKYIRNFESDRLRYQMVTYPMLQDGQVSNYDAYLAGKANAVQSAYYQPQPPEELYDTQADPDEINNLAESNPEMLALMRARLRAHMLKNRDLGLLPEPLMESIDSLGDQTIYSYGASEGNYPLSAVLNLALLASDGDPANQRIFVEALWSDNPTIRYWGITGLRILGADAQGMDKHIEKALADPEPSVRIQAAIYIGRQEGGQARAVKFLIKEAKAATGDMHAAWALDAVKLLDLPNALAEFDITSKALVKGTYSNRLFKFLKAGGSLTERPPRGFLRK